MTDTDFRAQHFQKLPDFRDEMDRAFGFLMEKRQHSSDDNLTGCVSYIQRRLQCGYNRAATLVELMEQEGWVTAIDGRGARRLVRPTNEQSAKEGS